MLPTKLNHGQPLSYHDGKRWVNGRYWFEKVDLENHMVHVQYLSPNEEGKWEKQIIMMTVELFKECFKVTPAKQTFTKQGTQPYPKTVNH